ncbi:4Fe-4S binding protein [Desulfobaculum sp. SPO524]|uniref:4Fe-4S binding protein n=1 Tax=Desulfobaculum sp. SPO524 TaxID=3378071 RepID=UPI0038530058
MPRNHSISPSTVRLIVQAAFAVFCLYVGWRFWLFLGWASGAREAFMPRPPAVEAFLPISALLALKQLLTTGIWDVIHPAGLTILIAAMLIAFVARKGFCGAICPVGLVSRLLAALGRKLDMYLYLPRPLHWILTSIKYVLFAFFALSVLRMSPRGIQSFLQSNYNITADARMLEFFLHPSGTAVVIFAVLGVLGIVVPYFWCRYLCPYGALLGLCSKFSPLAVTRDEDACVDCGKCTRNCPGGIHVHTKRRITSPECIGCMKCVDVCPVKDCLGPAVPGVGRVSPYLPVILAVGVLLLMYGWAQYTGHWEIRAPSEMLKHFYSLALKG